MKVVISSFGSSGDFNPCLALGRALCGRGVDVLFLSNPYYEAKIKNAGLRFTPAGEYFDVFKEIADNPAYLHPRKGPRAVWELVLKTVPVLYRAMGELIEKESPDLVVCHLLEYGGMIAAIEQSTAYATLSPTPMGWMSVDLPGYPHDGRWPLPLRRLHARLMRGMMNLAFKHALNPRCRKQSIPLPFEKAADIFRKAHLNLGTWSKQFREPAADDPPNSTICGFVRDEHVKDWPDVPVEIAELFSGSKPPVVVGLGSTASLHGDEIYQNAAAACESLDWPCLLVGKDLAKYAKPERKILAADFAPYGWVFPRAGLVIHHGGLNTTAETLRAGVPGLVFPHGYDQFDNAIRTQIIGLAKRLKTSQAARPIFQQTIQSILNDAEMRNRAKAFKARLQTEPDGAEIAADQIIQVMGQCPK